MFVMTGQLILFDQKLVELSLVKMVKMTQEIVQRLVELSLVKMVKIQHHIPLEYQQLRH